MRRAAILSADLVASIIVVLWYLRGPWIDLYGFSFYLGRGDVWLATPPLARAFLSGMALILRPLVFVSVLLLLAASFLTCVCTRRFPCCMMRSMATACKLLIKYWAAFF